MDEKELVKNGDENIGEKWREFTGESSMHGIKYVHVPKVSMFRRYVDTINLVSWACMKYIGYRKISVLS